MEEPAKPEPILRYYVFEPDGTGVEILTDWIAERKLVTAIPSTDVLVRRGIPDYFPIRFIEPEDLPPDEPHIVEK